jgi:hypothetical protein
MDSQLYSLSKLENPFLRNGPKTPFLHCQLGESYIFQDQLHTEEAASQLLWPVAPGPATGCWATKMRTPKHNFLFGCSSTWDILKYH